MDGHQAANFLRGIADAVRAIGMVAENKQREHLGESMAYNGNDFEQLARSIDFYATEMQRG